MRACPEEPVLLLLSILTLFAGPALYHWMKKGDLIARTVERVIVTALVVLVVFLLVPESLSELGILAIGLMAAGYLLPGLLEISLRKSAHTWHLLSIIAALAGLVLHSMLDGAGLASSEITESSRLGAAIALHRLGVGLVLWLIVQSGSISIITFRPMVILCMLTE